MVAMKPTGFQVNGMIHERSSAMFRILAEFLLRRRIFPLQINFSIRFLTPQDIARTEKIKLFDAGAF